MFNSDAFMTVGFGNDIPEICKLFMMSLIHHKSKLDDSLVDYLQVFTLERETVGNMVFQRINNYQEIPEKELTISFPFEDAADEKVFCIDADEYHTYMLAKEY